jgi:hypothetical protein
LLTLLNAPTVAAYTAAGFWRDETINHLVRGMRERCRRLGRCTTAIAG